MRCTPCTTTYFMVGAMEGASVGEMLLTVTTGSAAALTYPAFFKVDVSSSRLTALCTIPMRSSIVTEGAEMV